MHLLRLSTIGLKKYFSAMSTSSFSSSSFSSSFSSSCILSKFATLDPSSLSAKNPYILQNLVKGEWKSTKLTYDVIDPLNGDVFILSPHTQEDELEDYLVHLRSVPKSGRHNPFKNTERYQMYGRVFQKVAEYLHRDEVHSFFTKCIQRTMPKSYPEAAAEVSAIRRFCENFSGDSVRFCLRGFTVAGDHAAQHTAGYRWPYGAVAVISPFNFPLKLPVLQMLGAAMVGNLPLVKTEGTQALPVEQFLRFLHFCGLPADEIDMINARGPVMSKLIEKSNLRMLQFTGSCEIAEHLSHLMNGRIKLEDAGFDWKILGADVSDLEYVAWQCDQDAYSLSGQKCSAQSILFAHTNWMNAGLIEKLATLAKRRKLENLTCCPVLSYTTEEIHQHVEALTKLEGAKLLFGGKELTNHKIPSKYAAYEPTAVYVPLDTLLQNTQTFRLATTELFGPVQVITQWNNEEEYKLIHALERIQQHLTAAIVSNDIQFIQRMIGESVNGTTFVGMRARTTGSPQNHWFGPAGDPRAAGIGTPEGVVYTWTCHREIIYDHGPVPKGWSTPAAT